MRPKLGASHDRLLGLDQLELADQDRLGAFPVAVHPAA